MAGGAKKATKKFEKNHLKGVLDKRKDFAKVKQRHQLKDKRKARKAKDLERAADVAEEENARSTSKINAVSAGADALKELTVDEFFQGGFEIPEPVTKDSKKTKKRKAEEKNVDAEDSSSEWDASVEENPVASDSEAGSNHDEPANGHKDDLNALAEKDPDFYKFLKENDSELLDFNEGADLAEIDELSDEEPPKKKMKKGSKSTGGERTEEVEEEEEEETLAAEKVVSLAMVNKWKSALVEKHSLRAMREIVLAFRAAAHANDEEDKEFKYAVSSAEVYHQLVVAALNHIPAVLGHHLPVKEAASGRVRVSTESKKYRSLTPLLSSHALSVLHLLENLSDDSTMRLTLSSLLPLLPYLLSFKKVLKTLLKVVVGIWSDPSCSEATRINAFLLIRRLAVVGDASIKEAILKSTYHGLVKGSRNTTVHTLPGINLIKNSAIELWGLDMGLGYTTAFTYIRQLSIHLRSTINQPTKDSYKIIYNWQYTHSLDFWSRVLSTLCSTISNPSLKKPEDCRLHPLIYPLIQVHLGALRLIPTPTYIPLRFHLTQSLLRISRSTDTYIPLIPSLIEVLQFPDLKEPAKPSTLKPLDFSTTLRAPKSYLRTRVYQDGVGEQVTELLAEAFGIWAKNIAFPELSIPPSVLLKRWLKEVSSPRGKEGKKGPAGGHGSTGAGAVAGAGAKGNKNAKLNSLVSLLLQKVAANAAFVEEKRTKVEYAVGNRREVDGFLRDVEWEDMPMGAFVAGLRKQREAREKLLEQGWMEEATRRKQDEGRGKDGHGEGAGLGDDEDEDEEMFDADEAQAS